MSFAIKHTFSIISVPIRPEFSVHSVSTYVKATWNWLAQSRPLIAGSVGHGKHIRSYNGAVWLYVCVRMTGISLHYNHKYDNGREGNRSIFPDWQPKGRSFLKILLYKTKVEYPPSLLECKWKNIELLLHFRLNETRYNNTRYVRATVFACVSITNL